MIQWEPEKDTKLSDIILDTDIAYNVQSLVYVVLVNVEQFKEFLQ